jgi:hypothetical protein
VPRRLARRACIVVFLPLACEPASGPDDDALRGPVTAPSDVVALPAGSTAIVVRWTDASTVGRRFRVERSLDDGATWETIAHRATRASERLPSVTDAGRAPERQACYRVLAFNTSVASPPSAMDCATPLAAPRNLVSDTLAGGAIEVRWEDHSSHEEGYEALAVWTDGYARIAEFPAGTTRGIVSGGWDFAATDVIVRAFRTVHEVRVYSDRSNPVWVP